MSSFFSHCCRNDGRSGDANDDLTDFRMNESSLPTSSSLANPFLAWDAYRSRDKMVYWKRTCRHSCGRPCDFRIFIACKAWPQEVMTLSTWVFIEKLWDSVTPSVFISDFRVMPIGVGGGSFVCLDLDAGFRNTISTDLDSFRVRLLRVAQSLMFISSAVHVPSLAAATTRSVSSANLTNTFSLWIVCISAAFTTSRTSSRALYDACSYIKHVM